MSIRGYLSAMLSEVEDGIVPVPAAWLRVLLDNSGGTVSVGQPAHYTVQEVAELVGRAPGTVRGWLSRGLIEGSYKLQNRDWRVPPWALEQFLAGQTQDREAEPSNELADLGEWRAFV